MQKIPLNKKETNGDIDMDGGQQSKQQIIDRLKNTTNILITVSTNPSVDELSAALSLTLILNKLKKQATAVFSGVIPPAIQFLEPQKTFEGTVDSLRDFIVALDKQKAGRIKYKVDGNMVRIFITPYRTIITQKDLEFSQGDFNVETIVALGVERREEIDKAISAHGRILHDATVITISAKNESNNLGSVDWQEGKVSSLCEMLVSLTEDLDPEVLDAQIATALLTGIVSATDRFSNQKTSPRVMTMAAQLMAAGANQQLIASKLQDRNKLQGAAPRPNQTPPSRNDNDGTVVLNPRSEDGSDDNAQATSNKNNQQPNRPKNFGGNNNAPSDNKPGEAGNESSNTDAKKSDAPTSEVKTEKPAAKNGLGEIEISHNPAGAAAALTGKAGSEDEYALHAAEIAEKRRLAALSEAEDELAHLPEVNNNTVPTLADLRKELDALDETTSDSEPTPQSTDPFAAFKSSKPDTTLSEPKAEDVNGATPVAASTPEPIQIEAPQGDRFDPPKFGSDAKPAQNDKDDKSDNNFGSKKQSQNQQKNGSKDQSKQQSNQQNPNKNQNKQQDRQNNKNNQEKKQESFSVIPKPEVDEEPIHVEADTKPLSMPPQPEDEPAIIKDPPKVGRLHSDPQATQPSWMEREISEPTLGGSLSATTSQAAEDKAREAEEAGNRNHTILNHSDGHDSRPVAPVTLPEPNPVAPSSAPVAASEPAIAETAPVEQAEQTPSAPVETKPEPPVVAPIEQTLPAPTADQAIVPLPPINNVPPLDLGTLAPPPTPEASSTPFIEVPSNPTEEASSQPAVENEARQAIDAAFDTPTAQPVVSLPPLGQPFADLPPLTSLPPLEPTTPVPAAPVEAPAAPDVSADYEATPLPPYPAPAPAAMPEAPMYAPAGQATPAMPEYNAPTLETPAAEPLPNPYAVPSVNPLPTDPQLASVTPPPPPLPGAPGSMPPLPPAFSSPLPVSPELATPAPLPQDNTQTAPADVNAPVNPGQYRIPGQ